MWISQADKFLKELFISTAMDTLKMSFLDVKMRLEGLETAHLTAKGG